MKIFYLANSYIPSRTANSIHVMKMCQALAQTGHDVTLVTFDSTHNEEIGVEDIYKYYGVDACFSVHKIPLRQLKGKMHWFALEAIRYIRKQDYDLVYTRCEIPALYLSYTSIPFIIEAHKPFVSQSKMLKPLFRHIFQSASIKRLITISDALRKMFAKAINTNDFDVKVLHDAADELPLGVNGKDLGWKGRDGLLQVGYFGHLYKGRGIEVILETANRLLDVDFHIVGGRDVDIEYWKSQLNSLNNVHFYGFVLPSEVADYRSKCDVLVAPYQKEVWVANKGHESSKYMSPLKIFEYMSSGKCIISSDMPVLREVLNETNSMLVDPEDANQWGEAIEICKDQQFRLNLSQKALEDFKSKYTWQKRAEAALAGINV